MAACYLEELTKAVYQLLIADTTLMALTTGVYDVVPQTAVYPYVAIGRVDGVAYTTFDEDGDEQIYNIDIYGKSLSTIKINQIAKRIKALLSRAETALNALSCCVLMFLYNGTVTRPDRDMETEGRQITVEFKVVIL